MDAIVKIPGGTFMKKLLLIPLLFVFAAAACAESQSAAKKPKPPVKIPRNRKLDPNIFPLLSDVYVGGANLDQDARIYVWNGCLLATLTKDAAEGRESLRVTVMNGAQWYGWGIHVYPEGEMDMGEFANGALHFFCKASNGTAPMKVGVKSGFATESWVTVSNGSYGFVTDGQWHELEIPLTDFSPSIRMGQVTLYFMMSQLTVPPAAGSVYHLDGVYWIKSSAKKALSGAVREASLTNK